MRQVFDIKSGFLAKAQELLGKDDIVSRQSIYTRTAASLGLKEERTYIILDGTEESIGKAETLLKGMATIIKDKEPILKNFDQIENKAAEGFGFLGI